MRPRHRIASALAGAALLAMGLGGCSHAPVEPRTGYVTVEISTSASPTGRVTITASQGYTKSFVATGTESRRINGVPFGDVKVGLDGVCSVEGTLTARDRSMNLTVRGKHCST